MKTKEYFKDSELSIDVFNKKYKLNDSEQYEDAIYRVADKVSKIEKEENKITTWGLRWFKEIMEDKWHPAGSIISGVGNPINHISLYNCTTVAIPEDSLESIANARYKVMKFAAYRQGLGIDFSNLRPRGSKINNSAKLSTGTINWMEDVNELAHHVGQSGRIPAMLFSLRSDHPDIEEFVTVKSELGKIVNANISIQAMDEFMEAVENNTTYKLKFNDIEKEIDARKLYNKILKNNLDWAEPGFQFKDKIRKYRNSDYVGYPVVSSNACSEKYLDATEETSGVCNLASINCELIPTNSDIELENYLSELVPSLVRFLDNVIDVEIIEKRAPITGQTTSQKALRRLGIGITNLHAWLLKLGFEYDSDDAIKHSGYLMERIMYHAYKASIELGKEKGNFGAFDKEKFEQSPYVKEMIKLGLEFTHMRNVELISIAPTGSLSTMFSKPVLSYGIEPAFGLYYWKRTRITGKYNYYFIVPNIVYEILKENGIDLKKHGLKTLTIKDSFDGKIGKPIAKLIDDNKHLFKFKPAKNINAKDKLKLMDSMAKYVDSSISTTYLLDENGTIEDVNDIYMGAWKSKYIKSVSVYRDSSRYGIIEFIPFKERIKQLYKQGKTPHESDLSESDLAMLDFDPYKDKKYVKVVNGDHTFKKHKFTAEGGDKFYVLIRNDEKQLFIINYKSDNRQQERFLKIGNELSELLVKKGFEEEANKQEMRSENSLNKLTRMLSSCLKHDLKLDALQIIDKYVIVGNLAFYIVKKVFNYHEESEKICTACGSKNIVPDGAGCWICVDCGSSKCG